MEYFIPRYYFPMTPGLTTTTTTTTMTTTKTTTAATTITTADQDGAGRGGDGS